MVRLTWASEGRNLEQAVNSKIAQQQIIQLALAFWVISIAG
jgi:hypothetical protein